MDNQKPELPIHVTEEVRDRLIEMYDAIMRQPNCGERAGDLASAEVWLASRPTAQAPSRQGYAK